jgi:hypothetical protein
MVVWRRWKPNCRLLLPRICGMCLLIMFVVNDRLYVCKV